MRKASIPCKTANADFDCTPGFVFFVSLVAPKAEPCRRADCPKLGWDMKDGPLLVMNELGGADGICGEDGKVPIWSIFLCNKTPRAAGNAFSTSNGRLTTCVEPASMNTCA